MADPPAVSVIVPTKNRWPILSRTALPSALGQEGVELEVVIVDDGSTDETAGRLAELASTDARVRVLRHDSSAGVAAARNAGITAARAPWVAFLDDDDVWSPRKLAAQLEAAARAGTSWVYSGAIAVTRDGDVLYEYYFPEPAIVADQLRRSAVVPAGASNVVARAEVIRELGGFDEQLSMLADWDLWIRLSETDRPASLRDVHVAVLYHSGSGHAVTDQSAELELLIRKHAARTPPVVDSIPTFSATDDGWRVSTAGRAFTGRLRGSTRATGGDTAVPTNALRALDALLGKRIGSRIVSRGVGRDGSSPAVAPPTWLVQAPYFHDRG